MRILGIESSSLVASVAIVEDDITMAEFTADFKKTHSQTLLPMIDDMVKLLGIELSTVDAIAVSGGPGSFTGLRIGSATAKGLGLALDKPLIHVPMQRRNAAARALADPGRHSLQPVRGRRSDLPYHGCQEKPGLYGGLPVPGRI